MHSQSENWFLVDIAEIFSLSSQLSYGFYNCHLDSRLYLITGLDCGKDHWTEHPQYDGQKFVMLCFWGSGISDPFTEHQKFLILLLRVWNFECQVKSQKFLIHFLRLRGFWFFCWQSGILIPLLRVWNFQSICWSPDPFIKAQNVLIFSLRPRNLWYFIEAEK